MYLDRTDLFRELTPDIKNKIKSLFDQFQFGANKLWAISIVPIKEAVVDLYPHFDFISIGKVRNSFVIFRGETDLLDGTKKIDKNK